MEQMGLKPSFMCNASVAHSGSICCIPNRLFFFLTGESNLLINLVQKDNQTSGVGLEGGGKKSLTVQQ